MSWFDRKKAAAAAQAQVQATQAAAAQAGQEELSPEQVYAQGYEDGMKAGNAAGIQAGTQAGIQAGIQQGIDQERARVTQVTEQVAAISCLIPAAAASTLLNSIVKSGATSEMAGQQIIGILEGQQANNTVVSTVSATSTGEANGLLADARRRAAAAKGGRN